MTLHIEKLRKNRHDRSSFDCGLAPVNAFLQQNARKQMEQKINQTWVITDNEASSGDPAAIVGFFTMAIATVTREDVPSEREQNQYPRYPLPVIKLAWLGVDKAHQGSQYRVGETLLLEALNRAHILFKEHGMGIAVVVDPLTRQSDQFFRKFGFKPMRNDFNGRPSLFLSRIEINSLIEGSQPADDGNSEH